MAWRVRIADDELDLVADTRRFVGLPELQDGVLGGQPQRDSTFGTPDRRKVERIA